MTKKTDRKINVAILGATGVVGNSMLEILAERKFPIDKIYALASNSSEGKTVVFGSRNLEVIDAAQFDFSQVQIALFSAGSEVSKKYGPKAAEAGCVVIDNTSCFRYETDIPLIIPEVNPQQISNYKNRNIIANPNCSTIQMLVAIKPIYDLVKINKITVATYQSVSGTGKSAIDELLQQTASLLNGRPVEASVYPQQIAFNVIPQIDIFMDNGFSKEEMKMIWETRKILNDPTIIVNPTTVRVPVIYGHSEAITLETAQAFTASQAKEILQTAPGVELIDNPTRGKYPTPFVNAVGNDPVYVGRVRNGLDDLKTLNMWVVADNIRKGAALNSIQIAELLLEYI